MGFDGWRKKEAQWTKFKLSLFCIDFASDLHAASMTLTNTAKCYKSAALCHSAPSGGVVIPTTLAHIVVCFRYRFLAAAAPYTVLSCCAYFTKKDRDKLLAGAHEASAVEPLFSFV